MTTIGNRYRIQRILGQGGMATVYAARDLQLERDVALKVLRPDLNASGDTLAQFQREARIAAGFNHPHIARVYDVGDDERSGPYFVQELVPGGLLAGMLPVRPEQALEWARQIATALDAIHGQGFIHCDVKPHNVQITPERQALLLDFGVAEAAGAECELIRGTPLYLAPERLYGSPPAPAADVYALGVMLYEMLAGSVPVPSETGQRQWPPLSQSALPAGAPWAAPAIEALLGRMTAANPADRPAMAEVAGQLAALLKQADAPTADQPVIRQRQTVPLANMATAAVPPPPKPGALAPVLHGLGQIGHAVTRVFRRRPPARRLWLLAPLLLIPLLLLAAWRARPETIASGMGTATRASYKVYSSQIMLGPVGGAPPAGAALLLDGFDEQRWPAARDRAWTLEYAGGGYRMAMNPGVNTLWSYSDDALPAGNLAFEADVDPRQGSGGLLFGWQGKDRYYRLLTAADGSYRLERRSGGQIIPLAAGQGAGKGRLGVALRGANAAVTFGEQVLAEVALPAPAEGKYGMILVGAGAGEMHFDNLALRQLP